MKRALCLLLICLFCTGCSALPAFTSVILIVRGPIKRSSAFICCDLGAIVVERSMF